MKIVFLGRYNQSEVLTGPEKVAKRIFTEYTKRDRAVFIEYFFDGRKSGFIKKLFGKEAISENNGSQILRLGLFSLLRYLIASKPDLIHIITYERFGAVAFFYKIISKVRIVYNVHGIIIHENINYKNISSTYFHKDKLCERIYMKYSDRLIFLSDESIRIASEYFKIDKNKITLLPNGVDEIFHLKGRTRDYSEVKLLKLVFNGSVSRKEKGFTFLEDTLRQSDVPFQLYLTGNSEQPGNKNYFYVSIKDTVSFAEFLSGMDVFISASEYEPFSIAAAEAMAAGAVPVVSKQTGMSRYIENNVNGFVFNLGDANELNMILKLIYSERAEIQKYSERSKEIYSLLNWVKVFDQYSNVYKSLQTFNKY